MQEQYEQYCSRESSNWTFGDETLMLGGLMNMIEDEPVQYKLEEAGKTISSMLR